MAVAETTREPVTRPATPAWTAVLHDWVSTVDHKRIGILYILMALVFLLVGGAEALRTIAAFRLALPRAVLRYAGGRELTLGDLGTEAGMLGGINAIIVGNYLTTLGRPAGADLDMLSRLKMPIKALSATL